MEKANSIIDISRIPSINTIERIEIPIIQRDYAQGRKERNIRIKRELFLDEIFSVICDSEENDLKLYYIYGKIDGTTFIPIDGQQRLTTLYLLAYYLSSRENCFKNFLNLPELTYRTRFSAKNFTAELRKNPLDYTNDSAQKPSEKIKQSGWFFSEYEFDPTVIAILTMLDSIHNKYEAIKESKKSCLLGCLFGNLKRIKFEVFSLDGKRPFSHGKFYTAFLKAMDGVGLTKPIRVKNHYVIHSCRRNFVSSLVAAGVSDALISLITGHDTVKLSSMNLRYSELLDEAVPSLVDTIDGIFDAETVARIRSNTYDLCPYIWRRIWTKEEVADEQVV